MKLPSPLLLLSALALPALASDVVRLDDLEVAATPIVGETRLDALASKVTAVTAAQLVELNARDLQSALRRVPGVVVSHFNPVGSFGGTEGGAVFIRGMGTARPGAEIQLSIDGVPSFNSIWTHPILDMLNVDLARRIEVHKGAQPVLYGNMAFAVVDLAPKFREQPGQGGALTLTTGSFGTWSAAAEGGYRGEKLDAYVLGSARASDGHRANADGRLRAGYVRLGWTLDERWSAHVFYNGTSNYADDPGPDPARVPPALQFGSGRFADDNDLVVATVTHRDPGLEGSLKAYSSRGKLDWTGQYHAPTARNENVTVTEYANRGLRLRETLRPAAGTEIVGGVDLDRIAGQYRSLTGGVAGSFPRTAVRIDSVYAAVSRAWALGRGWTVRPSLGARQLDHSVFADELAPQAGLVATDGTTEWHVSAARGVNFPGLFVMAIPPGNNRHRELSAETVDHAEMGVSRRLGEAVRVEVSVFRDDGADRIVTSYPPFPPVWKNLADFRTEGVEAAVTWAPREAWALYAAVTAMRATPDDLPYVPEWSGSAGLNWRLTRAVRLSVDGQYVGARAVLARNRDLNALNAARLGSYVLLNARLAYTFGASAWGLAGECFVAGENLGDADYEQKFGYPMPGASGTVGVSFSW
ncbi:MAG: TonB-dependent receptor plug domain-containing protein [Opitutaceae bacterium]|nr:TonB-dependent receptor plug domain-containing protein [Opitutaceae bacterium]